MTALPPIGSRVRTMAGDVGIVDEHKAGQWFGRPRIPYVFVAFPGGAWYPKRQQHGAWVTADEIEEVLP